MSESTSEDFSDSDSEVSEEEQKSVEKVAEKRKIDDSKDENEKSDDSDSDSDEEDSKKAPEPVKKRKTLQDYLIEKVQHKKINVFHLTSIFIYIFFRLRDKQRKKLSGWHGKHRKTPAKQDIHRSTH